MSRPGDEVAALAARAQVFRSRRADGGSIVWRCWPGPADRHPMTSPIARDTLLLLHGSYGSWTHWLRNIGAWSAAMTVVAVDMPGFGDSEALPSDPSPAALTDLLKDGWQQLCATRRDPALTGPGRVFVAGFSLGAVYAGWLARAMQAEPSPARPLAGLALLSPGGLGDRPAPRPGMRRVPVEGEGLPARLARLAVHRHNLSVVMFGDAHHIDDTAVQLQDANVRRARFRRPPGQAQDLLLEVLPRLGVPVLGLWGGRDAFDADVGVRVAALKVAAPCATTVVIPGAGHWVGYEAADEANRVLLQWLQVTST